jgi:repressor LexA
VKKLKKKLGEKIKEIREKKGLTQAYVSSKLGYKSSSMLSEIESGKKGLDAEKVPLLADILGVPIDKLFFDQKVHITRIKLIHKGE